MLTDGFSVLLVEAGLLTGQRSQREDSEPQLHVHITVVLIHSKTNTLPTVPSHTLDDSAAIRTEPGPRSLLPELPASPPRNTSVDPNSPDSNRPPSHLAARLLFWLPNKELPFSAIQPGFKEAQSVPLWVLSPVLFITWSTLLSWKHQEQAAQQQQPPNSC